MNSTKSLLVKGQCLAVAFGTVLLALPSPVKAQEVNPCRPLGKADTVVIIGASTEERVQVIKQVIQERGLQGEFCQNRSGKTVWMSDQIGSKDAAVQVFSYFQDAGLIRPIKMRRAV